MIARSQVATPAASGPRRLRRANTYWVQPSLPCVRQDRVVPTDSRAHEPSQFTAYAWVAPGWTLDSSPTALPAARVWGDVILELVSERNALSLRPPIATRATALFAWPTPLPPEPAAQETANRVRVQLEVDPSRCAAADVQHAHALYDPISWRRLREWLVDQGYDRDLVDEDLTPVLDPTAPMFVAKGRAVVESTNGELFEALLNYFEAPARQYLNTWAPLSDASIDSTTEIIVPVAAVLDVIR